MKKLIALVFLIMLIPVCASAQSSMTDDQVFEFVVEEHEKGTSQQQIVTKLIQRGVNIQQIRRVRSKYEKQISGQGLGYVADKAMDDAENRMRTNNGKNKKDDDESRKSLTTRDNYSNYRIWRPCSSMTRATLRSCSSRTSWDSSCPPTRRQC